MWGLGDHWATKGSHALKHANLILRLLLLLFSHPLPFITLSNNIFEHLLSSEDSAASKTQSLRLEVWFSPYHHYLDFLSHLLKNLKGLPHQSEVK